MRIRLLTQMGTHMPGSEHEVLHTINHGGHYDCAAQYVLRDGTHVPSNCASVVRWNAGELMPTVPDRHVDLNELLEQSRRAWEAMTPEQKVEHRAAQRASWIRAFTTGCEHGVLDFEQCPQCRKARWQRQ